MNGEFLWRMETILDLYDKPYDPLRPVVGFDECPYQVIGNTIQPLAMEPGKPLREDYHYQRHGVFNLLVAYEPLTGWRYVKITKRRTRDDYAQFLDELVKIRYSEVEKICLVQDNLNTHNPGSFYHHFPPEYAAQLTQKFEMNYTPTNGSWLNITEIEISAIARQCLKRRIANEQMLRYEVSACVGQRNAKRIKVNWQFTVNDAREKFHKHYNNPNKLI